MPAITFVIILLVLGGNRPVFVSDLWPGEGVPGFESTGAPLQLHAKPDRKSKVIQTYRVRRGWRILWDKTEYQTILPGTVKAKRAVTLEGRTFGIVPRLTKDDYYFHDSQVRVLKFNAGEQFEYLQYRAEGACFIRVGSEVIEIELCSWLSGDSDSFEMSQKPKTEWWVRVIEKNKPLGWVLLDDEAPIKWLKRSF
ncbi:MAG: hypothetical protein ACREEM_05085 [Blastocatellia bacterium]